MRLLLKVSAAARIHQPASLPACLLAKLCVDAGCFAASGQAVKPDLLCRSCNLAVGQAKSLCGSLCAARRYLTTLLTGRFVCRSLYLGRRACSMSISNELIWGIVRDTSCHVLRRKQVGRSGMGQRGAEFTTEPNNLTGLNAWKYSGLANSKTIDLASAGEKGVVLTTKSTEKASVGKPAKALKKVTYTRDFRRIAKAIKKQTSDKFYRSDLQKAALAKWSLIYASQKKMKAKKA